MKDYHQRPIGYVGIPNDADFQISPHAVIENVDSIVPVNEEYDMDRIIGKATNFKIVDNALVANIFLDDPNFVLADCIFRAGVDIQQDEFHNAKSLTITDIALIPAHNDSFIGIIE